MLDTGSQRHRPFPIISFDTASSLAAPCQARGIIRDSPEAKRTAMRQAAGYRPAGNMVIDEEMRLAMVKQQAMGILLKRFFDKAIEAGREVLKAG